MAGAIGRALARVIGRYGGAMLPLLAVLAIAALLAALDALVELHHAVVPKPRFQSLLLPGYPNATPLAEAAAVVDAALWWLCLSFLQWLVGLGVIVLCGLQLHRAMRHQPRLAAGAWAAWAAALLVVAAMLYQLAVVRRTPLLAFGPLVENLALLSPRLVRLGSWNAALAFVASTALWCSFSLLLWPGAHGDRATRQMRSITVLMYGGAVLMLVWITSLTAMYRLCATLMDKPAREPALALAPSISLMGGLLLSLLLASAFLSAAAWLQHCHQRECRHFSGGRLTEAGPSPKELLAAHWPRIVAFLVPMLPGAAASVLQALGKGP